MSNRKLLAEVFRHGYDSWSRIFEKLSKINQTSPKEVGTLFEIFCKHFFLANPRFKRDYKNVWLGSEVPSPVKKRLNLTPSDYGYDLVLETVEGKYAVVQCKFTSHQEQKTLNWTGTNLSSWLAISSKADIRIIFTNASGIDLATRKKAREKEFFEFNLSSLLELNKDDLRGISKSIQGKKPTQRRFKPRPHQLQAIKAVLSGFKKSNRGKLILPCGAGKTLTALWVKDSIKPAKTLVLVPSLALLRQFRNDWRAQEKQITNYLCVCSERDIASDQDTIESTSSELGSPVTTDPKVIRRYLKSSSPLVVYSTYQSSPQLAAAMQGTRLKFDFVVCDEAHRTTGDRRGSRFATILDDKNIRASKRLFMTATPRIVAEKVKNRLGEEQLRYIADMSDPGTYGPEFFRMSFAEAIRKKILVDYKIIAIGVTDKELRKAIRRRAFASNTTIDEIANNFALEKVMKRYGCNHAVTFHSSVRRAEQFKERHIDFCKNSQVFHVNGSQPTSERDCIIKQEFQPAKRAVITNARCLTEGVDVPAIDCVYFCDPKYSKIDIVQASGRALRINRDKEKTFGYVVVPVFHAKGEGVEKSIENGSFKNLISVVRAMADQDQRIEEEIREIAYGHGEGTAKRLRVSLPDKGKTVQLFQLVDFYGKLGDSIFTQVIRKAVVPWRTFDQAKAFVQGLNLKSVNQWQRYCVDGIPGIPRRPADIPSNPERVFEKEWKTWGDWLGTCRIADQLRSFRSFEAARSFVRRLKLKTQSEWRKYCNGQLKRLPPLPSDIPKAPDKKYVAEWQGMPDWLGNGRVSPGSVQYRSFEKARDFVRHLKLRNNGEWRAYCRGTLKGKPRKPIDIPFKPERTYSTNWLGYGDWIGSSRRRGNFWSFKVARDFVRKLNIRSSEEWFLYC
ncbi:MAG: DEAD/DEAH box helicase family protein, partial [Bdellovibrionota bacterium]